MRGGTGRKTKKKASSVLPVHNNEQDASSGMKKLREFPMSPYMLVASFLFWVCLTFAGIKGFQYLSVHISIDNSDLLAYCDAVFSRDLDTNLKVIENINEGSAGPYLKRIGSQKFGDTFLGESAPRELSFIPPIVIAVSSADFWNVQGLIQQIHNGNSKDKNLGLQLIIYDIGLYKSEKELLKKHCDCDFRTFTFDLYPPHVSDKTNNAYRPIIIQMMLEEFKAVVWLDPDVRIQSITDLNMLKFRGARNFFLWEFPVFTDLVAYTNPGMFQYLGEQRCAYAGLGIMDTKTMVLYRTNITWLGVMKPWLKCALNLDCIAPAGARNSECFHYKRPKYTGCHWYEQSIISIIVNRVFQFSSYPDKFSSPRFTWYHDNEVIYYFPEQPWSWNEITFFTIAPLMCLGFFLFLYLKRQHRINAQKPFYERR